MIREIGILRWSIDDINFMYDILICYKNIMIWNYEIVYYLYILGDLLNVRYIIIIFIGLNNNL